MAGIFRDEGIQLSSYCDKYIWEDSGISLAFLQQKCKYGEYGQRMYMWLLPRQGHFSLLWSEYGSLLLICMFTIWWTGLRKKYYYIERRSECRNGFELDYSWIQENSSKQGDILYLNLLKAIYIKRKYLLVEKKVKDSVIEKHRKKLKLKQKKVEMCSLSSEIWLVYREVSWCGFQGWEKRKKFHAEIRKIFDLTSSRMVAK